MEKVLQQVASAKTSFARPANTTAYADGDVVGDSDSAVTTLKFAGACGDGGGGIIRSATLTSSAIPGTKLNADLWLFDSEPANAYGNDNEAFALHDDDRSKLIGVIPLDGSTAANVKASSNNYAVINQGLAIPFEKPRSSGSKEDKAIYGVLVARNAYTPASAENITLRLGIEKA